MSNDDGVTFNATRCLTSPYPIRSVLALPSGHLIAAGGNYYSGVGGIWESVDRGRTWGNTLSITAEIKACRAVPMKTATRVLCVCTAGDVYTTDVSF